MRRRIQHQIIDGVDHKWCKQCNNGEGKWVPSSNFNKKVASYDQLETKCKDCAQEKSANFRTENSDYDKEYQKKNSEKLKQYKKEYYLKKKLEKELG